MPRHSPTDHRPQPFRGHVSFATERAKLQEQLEQHANQGVKRFLSLDHQAYQDGVLPAKTKELLGLAASLVLRCDDCITFHLLDCHKQGVVTGELMEAFNIALIVGGSITIPHLRRALDTWLTLEAEGDFTPMPSGTSQKP